MLYLSALEVCSRQVAIQIQVFLHLYLYLYLCYSECCRVRSSGPILFLLYVSDLSLLQLVKRHGLQSHCYADDTQIYGFSDPSDVDALQEHLSVCIDEVFSWMMFNWLQLNLAKTEVLWCSSARRQHQISTGPARVGDTSVLPVRTVRDLGGSILTQTST